MKKLCLAMLCALSVAACKPTSSTEPIKIGFIGPLTGDAAALGVDILHGIQIAVDDANATGGIDGRQIQIVAEDGRCTGADAASAAQKLINVDKVVAILGGQCSGETLAIAPIAEAAGVPIISAISSNPDVTEAGEFIFRVYPSDALKTVVMAKYFAVQGWDKVAILSTNADFSVGFRDALKADLPAGFIFDEVVDPTAKDFRTVLTRLTGQDFDVFVPNSHANAPMALMIEQFREQGLTQPMVSHDVADTLDVIAAAGDAAEGLQSINVPTIEADTDFGRDFITAHGQPQAGMFFAAFGYDAANVLLEAIRNMGDGPLRDAIAATDRHPGVVGPISFDENGDVVGVSYDLKEVQNGAYKTLRALPL